MPLLTCRFAHHDISFEISANGRTIYESDHYNNLFAPDGTSVAAGSETHILGENGEIVLLDAGASCSMQMETPPSSPGSAHSSSARHSVRHSCPN